MANWQKLRSYPEVGETVIVTMNGEDIIVDVAIYTANGDWLVPYISKDFADESDGSGFETHGDSEIIAWCPLPKPPKN